MPVADACATREPGLYAIDGVARRDAARLVDDQEAVEIARHDFRGAGFQPACFLGRLKPAPDLIGDHTILRYTDARRIYPRFGWAPVIT